MLIIPIGYSYGIYRLIIDDWPVLRELCIVVRSCSPAGFKRFARELLSVSRAVLNEARTRARARPLFIYFKGKYAKHL